MDNLNVTSIKYPYTWWDQEIRSTDIEPRKVSVPFTYNQAKYTSKIGLGSLYNSGYSGDGFIAGQVPGIVTKESLPIKAMMYLFERGNLKVIRQTMSNQDGTYRFDSINENYLYDVLARDPEGVYFDAMVNGIKPWSKYFKILDEPILILYDALIPYSFATTIKGGTPPYSLDYTPKAGVTITLEDNILTLDIDELEDEFTFTINSSGGEQITRTIVKTQVLYQLDENGTDGLFAGGNFGDDNYIGVPVAFKFFNTNYQSVYVGSNSYMTFDQGRTDYSGWSASAPGKGIIIAGADHGYGAVYYGQNKTATGTVVRYTSTRIGNQSWEITYYDTGVISVLPLKLVSGYYTNTYISNGSTTTNFACVSNSMMWLTPSQDGLSYAITDYVPLNESVAKQQAAHKYWRISITEYVGHTALAELEMATEAGGPTVCTGGVAISSGNQPTAPSHIAANAFDGSTNEDSAYAWASDLQYRGWIGYTFASPVAIREIRIAPRLPYYNQYPTAFTVQYSDNGISWYSVESYSGITSGWTANTFKVFSVLS